MTEERIFLKAAVAPEPTLVGIAAGDVDVDLQGKAHMRRTLDPAVRRRVNGETERVMIHVSQLKNTQTDTSVDQPWPIDESLSGRDSYVKAVSAVCMGIKFILLFFPLCIVQVPFILMLWFYVACLPTPCDSPIRTSCSFRSYLLLVTMAGLPMLFLAMLSYLFDMFCYYFFSVSFCLVTWGWSRYSRSLKAIAPYCNGPWLFFAWSDVVTSLLGQVWRHGLTEATVMLANTWLFIPWAKYFVNTNPFIYDLEERMVQQISTSMQDMSIADITRAGLRIMSRTKQREELQGRIDKWKFAPHYPYPPPWKRWTIGIQAGGNRVPICFFLFVHTTHALCTHCNSTEQFVLSDSIASPGYRVMLWYNNPYHFFTGWVEASLSTGGISQPDKNRGGEHPMWIVTSHSPLLADRWSKIGTGFIDNFFDEWLPTIVNEIRRLNRGEQAAQELEDHVISKDGISRPACGKKVPFTEPGTPARAFFSNEQAQYPVLHVHRATE